MQRKKLPRTVLLSLALLLPGCVSNEPTSLEEELGTPYDASLMRPEDKPIGPYLTEMSLNMAAWSNLVASGVTQQDQDKVRVLREGLMNSADARFDDLVDQLQLGPPVNREVAAAALGFSNREEALAPLLAALEDSSDTVVRNALLGLSQLRDPRTPLGPIVDALRFSTSAEVRGNAALTLRILLAEVKVEHDPDAVQRVARGGITDPSPVVRTQCALILAALENPDSIEPLEALLSDEVLLVASAAARSLAYIGTRNNTVTGRCARALSGSLPTARFQMRERLISNLKLLRSSVSDGLAFEDEPEEWLRWAHGLP